MQQLRAASTPVNVVYLRTHHSANPSPAPTPQRNANGYVPMTPQGHGVYGASNGLARPVSSIRGGQVAEVVLSASKDPVIRPVKTLIGPHHGVRESRTVTSPTPGRTQQLTARRPTSPPRVMRVDPAAFRPDTAALRRMTPAQLQAQTTEELAKLAGLQQRPSQQRPTSASRQPNGGQRTVEAAQVHPARQQKQAWAEHHPAANGSAKVLHVRGPQQPAQPRFEAPVADEESSPLPLHPASEHLHAERLLVDTRAMAGLEAAVQAIYPGYKWRAGSADLDRMIYEVLKTNHPMPLPRLTEQVQSAAAHKWKEERQTQERHRAELQARTEASSNFNAKVRERNKKKHGDNHANTVTGVVASPLPATPATPLVGSGPVPQRLAWDVSTPAPLGPEVKANGSTATAAAGGGGGVVSDGKRLTAAAAAAPAETPGRTTQAQSTLNLSQLSLDGQLAAHTQGQSQLNSSMALVLSSEPAIARARSPPQPRRGEKPKRAASASAKGSRKSNGSSSSNKGTRNTRSSSKPPRHVKPSLDTGGGAKPLTATPTTAATAGASPPQQAAASGSAGSANGAVGQSQRSQHSPSQHNASTASNNQFPVQMAASVSGQPTPQSTLSLLGAQPQPQGQGQDQAAAAPEQKRKDNESSMKQGAERKELVKQAMQRRKGKKKAEKKARDEAEKRKEANLRKLDAEARAAAKASAKGSKGKDSESKKGRRVVRALPAPSPVPADPVLGTAQLASLQGPQSPQPPQPQPQPQRQPSAERKRSPQKRAGMTSPVLDAAAREEMTARARQVLGARQSPPRRDTDRDGQSESGESNDSQKENKANRQPRHSPTRQRAGMRSPQRSEPPRRRSPLKKPPPRAAPGEPEWWETIPWIKERVETLPRAMRDQATLELWYIINEAAGVMGLHEHEASKGKASTQPGGHLLSSGGRGGPVDPEQTEKGLAEIAELKRLLAEQEQRRDQHQAELEAQEVLARAQNLAEQPQQPQPRPNVSFTSLPATPLQARFAAEDGLAARTAPGALAKRDAELKDESFGEVEVAAINKHFEELAKRHSLAADESIESLDGGGLGGMYPRAGTGTGGPAGMGQTESPHYAAEEFHSRGHKTYAELLAEERAHQQTHTTRPVAALEPDFEPEPDDNTVMAVLVRKFRQQTEARRQEVEEQTLAEDEAEAPQLQLQLTAAKPGEQKRGSPAVAAGTQMSPSRPEALNEEFHKLGAGNATLTAFTAPPTATAEPQQQPAQAQARQDSQGSLSLSSGRGTDPLKTGSRPGSADAKAQTQPQPQPQPAAEAPSSGFDAAKFQQTYGADPLAAPVPPAQQQQQQQQALRRHPESLAQAARMHLTGLEAMHSAEMQLQQERALMQVAVVEAQARQLDTAVKTLRETDFTAKIAALREEQAKEAEVKRAEEARQLQKIDTYFAERRESEARLQAQVRERAQHSEALLKRLERPIAVNIEGAAALQQLQVQANLPADQLQVMQQQQQLLLQQSQALSQQQAALAQHMAHMAQLPAPQAGAAPAPATAGEQKRPAVAGTGPSPDASYANDFEQPTARSTVSTRPAGGSAGKPPLVPVPAKQPATVDDEITVDIQLSARSNRSNRGGDRKQQGQGQAQGPAEVSVEIEAPAAGGAQAPSFLMTDTARGPVQQQAAQSVEVELEGGAAGSPPKAGSKEVSIELEPHLQTESAAGPRQTQPQPQEIEVEIPEELAASTTGVNTTAPAAATAPAPLEKKAGSAQNSVEYSAHFDAPAESGTTAAANGTNGAPAGVETQLVTARASPQQDQGQAAAAAEGSGASDMSETTAAAFEPHLSTIARRREELDRSTRLQLELVDKRSRAEVWSEARVALEQERLRKVYKIQSDSIRRDEYAIKAQMRGHRMAQYQQQLLLDSQREAVARFEQLVAGAATANTAAALAAPTTDFPVHTATHDDALTPSFSQPHHQTLPAPAETKRLALSGPTTAPALSPRLDTDPQLASSLEAEVAAAREEVKRLEEEMRGRQLDPEVLRRKEARQAALKQELASLLARKQAVLEAPARQERLEAEKAHMRRLLQQANQVPMGDSTQLASTLRQLQAETGAVQPQPQVGTPLRGGPAPAEPQPEIEIDLPGSGSSRRGSPGHGAGAGLAPLQPRTPTLPHFPQPVPQPQELLGDGEVIEIDDPAVSRPQTEPAGQRVREAAGDSLPLNQQQPLRPVHSLSATQPLPVQELPEEIEMDLPEPQPHSARSAGGDSGEYHYSNDFDKSHSPAKLEGPTPAAGGAKTSPRKSPRKSPQPLPQPQPVSQPPVAVEPQPVPEEVIEMELPEEQPQQQDQPQQVEAPLVQFQPVQPDKEAEAEAVRRDAELERHRQLAAELQALNVGDGGEAVFVPELQPAAAGGVPDKPEPAGPEPQQQAVSEQAVQSLADSVVDQLLAETVAAAVPPSGAGAGEPPASPLRGKPQGAGFNPAPVPVLALPLDLNSNKSPELKARLVNAAAQGSADEVVDAITDRILQQLVKDVGPAGLSQSESLEIPLVPVKSAPEDGKRKQPPKEFEFMLTPRTTTASERMLHALVSDAILEMQGIYAKRRLRAKAAELGMSPDQFVAYKEALQPRGPVIDQSREYISKYLWAVLDMCPEANELFLTPERREAKKKARAAARAAKQSKPKRRVMFTGGGGGEGEEPSDEEPEEAQEEEKQGEEGEEAELESDSDDEEEAAPGRRPVLPAQLYMDLETARKRAALSQVGAQHQHSEAVGLVENENQQIFNKALFDALNERLHELRLRHRRHHRRMHPEPWHEPTAGLGGRVQRRLTEAQWRPPSADRLIEELATKLSQPAAQLSLPPQVESLMVNGQAGYILAGAASKPGTSLAPGLLKLAAAEREHQQPNGESKGQGQGQGRWGRLVDSKDPMRLPVGAGVLGLPLPTPHSPLGLDKSGAQQLPSQQWCLEQAATDLVDALLEREQDEAAQHQSEEEQEWLDCTREADRVVADVADVLLYDLLGETVLELDKVQHKRADRKATYELRARLEAQAQEQQLEQGQGLQVPSEPASPSTNSSPVPSPSRSDSAGGGRKSRREAVRLSDKRSSA